MNSIVSKLAVVPARRNSKRLPNKNMRLLCGKPLIQWTLEAALAAKSINDVLVTTDDPAILDLAAALGARYCLQRPASLATDEAKTSDVVVHALDWISQQGVEVDVMCLLQPTSPLRSSEDIDAAFKLYVKAPNKSIVSVCEVDHPLAWCAPLGPGGSMEHFGDQLRKEIRSQDHQKTFRLNGAIYISSVESYRKNTGIDYAAAVAYVMSRHRSIDIDEMFDLAMADFIMSNGCYS